MSAKIAYLCAETGCFGRRVDEVKLRRAAVIGQCVDFHLDDASATVQDPLVEEEEYVGGQLAFLTKKRGLKDLD